MYRDYIAEWSQVKWVQKIGVCGLGADRVARRKK